MKPKKNNYLGKNYLWCVLAGVTLAFFMLAVYFIFAVLRLYQYQIISVLGSLARLEHVPPEVVDQFMSGKQSLDYEKGLALLSDSGYGKSAFFHLLDFSASELFVSGMIFLFIIIALAVCLIYYDNNHRCFLQNMKKRVWGLWTSEGQKYEPLHYKNRDAEALIYAVDYGMLIYRCNIQQVSRERKKVYSFMEDVSHQLKTPLSLMRLYVERIEMEDISHEIRGKLNQCQLSIQQMSNLISYLLQIGKLDAGKVKIELKKQSIKNFLESVINDLMCLAITKNIEILLTCPDYLEFYFDDFWMREAVENLLKNSIEHSPASSRITITVEERRRGCDICLSDCGTGIEPGNLPHVFDRFHQTSRQKDQSNGLGLTIARKVMQYHFGTLDVRNNEGAGVTFIAHLPYLRGTEVYS